MSSLIKWNERRVADRLARYAWLILLLSVAVALVGGVVLLLAPDTGGDERQVVVDTCENPPCFGGEGLPSLSDLPWVVLMVGFGLAVLLGVPSLLAGIWDLARGRGAIGARRLLVFIGPLLVLGLTEILPHLVNPCSVPYLLGSRDLPGFCQVSPDWGADVEDRYHLLDHALVGALPLVALYRLALGRWRPDVVLSRSPTRQLGGYRS